MSLYDMDTDTEIDSVSKLWHKRKHQQEFEAFWHSMTQNERDAIEREINRRLDELIARPDENWGSITNASIEGGKVNPNTGIRGDWSGTAFQPIYEACGLNEELAGMRFGMVWKGSLSSGQNTGLDSTPIQRFRSEESLLKGRPISLI
jgi:hypothetical protein